MAPTTRATAAQGQPEPIPEDGHEHHDIITVKDSYSQSEFHDCNPEPPRPTPSLFGKIPLPQLRQFDKTNIEQWFRELSTQLTLCKAITEQDRYVALLGYLDSSNRTLADSWLAEATVEAETAPFTFLREKLLHRYRISEHERLQRMMTARPRSDTLPSEFLVELKQLAGGHHATLVREMWIKHLPHPVIALLQSPTMKDLPMDALATFADSFQATTKQTAPPTTPTTMAVDVNQTLDDRLERLEVLLTSKSFEPKKPPQQKRPQQHTTSITPAAPPLPPVPANGVCWYHAKFGTRARKCQCPKNE